MPHSRHDRTGNDPVVSQSPSDLPGTYLRAVELWRTRNDDESLVHAGGYYSHHRVFGDKSREMVFPKGQGLIGRCAATGKAQLSDELSSKSGFLRSEAAQKEGINLAIAFPLERLGDGPGVLSFFFCHRRGEPSGGVELWDNVPELDKWGLEAAHHGSAEEFRRVSSQFRFDKGVGLPGRIAQSQLPELLNRLDDTEFLRAVAAESSGFTQAIGLPVPGPAPSVLVLLGHLTQPVAWRAEIWERASGGDFEPKAVQRATPQASIVFDRIPWLERAERLREPVVFSFLEPGHPQVPHGGVVLPYFSNSRTVCCVLIW
jgi:hypothetical protein